DAVELIDQSNRRTEDTLSERRVSLDSLIATLDIRTEDLEQRLKRLSTLLDSSLEGATGRAREIASLVSDTATEGSRALSEQYEAIRSISDEQRERMLDSMRGMYAQTSGEAEEMLGQSAARFTEIMEGLRQMAGEMQRELDTTRAELRRGILELP